MTLFAPRTPAGKGGGSWKIAAVGLVCFFLLFLHLSVSEVAAYTVNSPNLPELLQYKESVLHNMVKESKTFLSACQLYTMYLITLLVQYEE